MNKYLLYVLSILVFAGCKKDKDIDSAPPAEIEKWKPISNNIIFWGNRNIIDSYSDSDNLFFLTPNIFYRFDSLLVTNSAIANDMPNYYSVYLTTKISKNFRVFTNSDWTQITVADNIRAYNRRTVIFKDQLLKNGKGDLGLFTAPNKNDCFYLSYIVGNRNGASDSVYIGLNKYKLSWTTDVKADLVWSKPITNKQISYNGFEVSFVNEIDDIVYATIYDRTYRIIDGVVTDTIPNSIENIIKINDLLFACCGSSYQVLPYINLPAGLLTSSDNGKSWNYIANGQNYSYGTLANIANKVFIYRASWIAFLDLQKGLVKKINTTEVNGPIKTLNFFRDSVYIGTDAGVYYKSYKEFYNFD